MSSEVESNFPNNCLNFPFSVQLNRTRHWNDGLVFRPRGYALVHSQALEHPSVTGHTTSPLQAFTLRKHRVLCDGTRIYSPKQTTPSSYTIGCFTEETLEVQLSFLLQTAYSYLLLKNKKTYILVRHCTIWF